MDGVSPYVFYVLEHGIYHIFFLVCFVGGLYGGQNMCEIDLFSIYQEICNANSIPLGVTTFLKNVQLVTNFQTDLHFSKEMYNSNRFLS